MVRINIQMKRIKLFFDRKNGNAFYLGNSCVVDQRTNHSLCQKGAERYMGAGASAIIYNASKTVAKKRFHDMVIGMRETDLNALREVLDHLSMCGFGLFMISRFGKETVIHLKNSSNALKHRSHKPACYVISGFLAGIMELITGRECVCIEESCIARGDRICIFRVRSFAAKAEPVKDWWKTRKPPRGVEETFVDYDERRGEITFKGAIPSLISARHEECELQKEFKRIVGPAYKSIMYDMVGRLTTTDALGMTQRLAIKVIRLFSKRKIGEIFLEQFYERGYGLAEIMEFDAKNQKVKLMVKNSFIATGYSRTKEPVCYSVAGIFAGAGDVLFSRRMECEETKCIAKGDKHCEFEIYPGKS